MTAEWILTTEECAAHGLLAIIGMKGLVTKETVYKIQEVTANAQAKKLLEYLIAKKAIGVSVEDNEDDEIMMIEVETLGKMLKQLEKGQ